MTLKRELFSNGTKYIITAVNQSIRTFFIIKVKNRFLIIKVKNRFLIIKVKNRFLIIKVSFSLYKEILCLVSTFRRNNGTKICTFCHDKLYVFGMILVEKILGFYNYYNRANSSLPYGNIHSYIDKNFVFMRKKNHRKIFI